MTINYDVILSPVITEKATRMTEEVTTLGPSPLRNGRVRTSDGPETGAGVEEWCRLLEERLRAKRAAAAG